MSDELTPLDVKALATREKEQTRRYLIVGLSAVASVWIIGHYTAAVLSQPKTLWDAVCILAAGGVGYLAAPTVPVITWVRKFRKYISIHAARAKALEDTIDPERSSSNLLEDGRHPVDG